MRTTDKTNKFDICIVTLPFVDPIGEKILSKFIDILEPLSNELFVITGKFPDRSNERIHILRIKSDDKKEFTLIRTIKYIVQQLRTTFKLIKISGNVDVVIFHIGTGIDTLPILFLKLLRKKIVLVETGAGSKVAERDNKRLFGFGKIIFPFIFRILEHVNFHLADQIAVESESVIYFSGLKKYRNKINIGAMHVDTNFYKIKKYSGDKRNLIGFIGHLSPDKGVTNFVKAIPLILKERNDLEFLIGTIGQLLGEIKNELKSSDFDDKVELTGWIPHGEFPNYLNELKLIVLPSYTEGLPNIVLESMACGTPVLATPVGGIPDVIKDGKTGFILENNSPECIARNVIRVLNYPDLDRIVKNAKKLIEKEYTYKSAVERYRKILENV
jgi:glycosyltransferase involved in cell wall biosynthesis